MSAIAKQDEQPFDPLLWQHCAIFLFSFAILVLRRPDAVFHAQFWAEDGKVFFADAYNTGWWGSLFHTNVGYFHALPRIGAALALLVPLSRAPLVLNLIALAAQALPVNMLISSRSSAWGTLRYRAILAAIYLALPNCRELSATITNSQCLLALSAFLLLVGTMPKSIPSRLSMMLLLLLAGLSGPYCFFLLPIALFLAWKYRDRWQWASVAALALSCLVQAWGLLVVSPTARPHFSLGASPVLFARILAGPVYLGTLIGANVLGAHPGTGFQILLVCAAVLGTAIILVCFVKSNLEMRLFILFSSMVLAASLIAPIAHPPPGGSLWQEMAGTGGIHYWFFPTLAFAWSILWCIRSRMIVPKTVSIALLCVMCIGILRDWRHPAFQDMQFAEKVSLLQAAPAGTAITIPLNPPGWEMRLVKHPEH
jgi:hypothetical protein